jgi:CHASE2 domain-containing sensor protein/signal transduction histidine kinase
MPDQTAKRRARRTTFRNERPFGEWAWVTVFLLVLASVIGWQNGLNHIELSFLDSVLVTEMRPPDKDIVLVGIDDKSVAQYGQWPFNAQVQAGFFTRINEAHTRAVGVLSPMGDTSVVADGASTDPVAALILANGHVALNPGPYGNGPERVSSTTTSQSLLSAAAASGSAQNVADDDGKVRRAALATKVKGGTDNVPTFVAAVLEAAKIETELPGRRASEVDGGPNGVGDHWILIPYSGPAGHYPVLSYADIVSGAVPASALTGKIVLVGQNQRSTDTRRVPDVGLTEFGSSHMTRLEIIANTLAAVLEKRAIVAATPAANALGCALPVLIAMLVLLLRPRRALLFVVLIAGVTVAASALLMPFANLWFAPGGALACLALALPLWRWRQLEGDAVRVDAVMARLEASPDHYAEATLGVPETNLSRVELRIQALTRTVYRVNELRYFIDHIIEALPQSVLVTNADGHIVAANRQARNYFASLGNTRLDGAQLPYLLGLMTLEGSAEGKSWWDIMDLSVANPQARARDVRNRDMLVRAAAWNCINGEIGGWIALVEDVSVVRTLERRRNEVLQFMSETVVTAHRSIVEALAQVDRDQLDDATHDALASASVQALALTEKFVELSNAESRDYVFAVSDIKDAIELAVDGAYGIAGERGIELAVAKPDEPILVNIDMLMISRAVSVLINNAMRFSENGQPVHIEVSEMGGEAVIRVSDEGRGIAPLQQARLIRGLQPIHSAAGINPIGGFGLGLSLVRTVTERHHGRLEFSSTTGQGAEFRIILPAVQVEEPEDLSEQAI